MDKNQLEGKWDELKGQIKEKWGKFTNDDIMVIDGKRDQLIGRLCDRYGYSKEKAKTECSAFMKDFSATSSDDFARDRSNRGI